MTHNVPAESAWIGRSLIIGLNLTVLGAYLGWSASLSRRIESDSSCSLCFSPHATALIYAVVFVGPALIISLSVALQRYRRRPKVLRSGALRGESLGPAAVDALTGLAIGLLTMLLVHFSSRLL